MRYAGFAHLARLVGTLRSRRAVVALLGSALTVPAAALSRPASVAEAKKKKKKKKKVTLCLNGQTVKVPGKKKKTYLAQGATLGACPPTGCTPTCAGKTCGPNGCGGSCGSCGADQLCQGGVCACKPDRQCGEICCAEEIACFAEGCACANDLCRCTGERTFCSTPDFTQCCAVGDTCDPVAACVTDTCSAENDACTVGGAFCGDGFCLCTTSAAGSPYCADFDLLTDCPATSACDDDTGCTPGETCANVSCCSDDGETFFGVCLPPCPAARSARATPAHRAHMRRQLTRTLHLDPTRARSAAS